MGRCSSGGASVSQSCKLVESDGGAVYLARVHPDDFELCLVARYHIGPRNHHNVHFPLHDAIRIIAAVFREKSATAITASEVSASIKRKHELGREATKINRAEERSAGVTNRFVWAKLPQRLKEQSAQRRGASFVKKITLGEHQKQQKCPQ